MNKIKDFIYDKNDIVIALLILVVAALIIFWRLDIILEYPKTLLSDDDIVVETPSDDDVTMPGDTSEDPVVSGDDNTENTDQTDENDQTITEDPVEIPLWDGGMLTKDVEVEVEEEMEKYFAERNDK